MSTFNYYKKRPKFALIDMAFGFIALFVNPYRVCRKFLQKKGEENIYAYGETPYLTYEKIARECGLTPQDTWIELGSGRGKGCFWLNQFIGCKTIGVDWVPSFIFFAQCVKRFFGVKGVEFKCTHIEKADLSQATFIYLYGLWPNLNIPKGVKVITTGEPLEGCRVLKQFWVRFPWGRTAAYLQIQA